MEQLEFEKFEGCEGCEGCEKGERCEEFEGDPESGFGELGAGVNLREGNFDAEAAEFGAIAELRSWRE